MFLIFLILFVWSVSFFVVLACRDAFLQRTGEGDPASQQHQRQEPHGLIAPHKSNALVWNISGSFHLAPARVKRDDMEYCTLAYFWPLKCILSVASDCVQPSPGWPARRWSTQASCHKNIASIVAD